MIGYVIDYPDIKVGDLVAQVNRGVVTIGRVAKKGDLVAQTVERGVVVRSFESGTIILLERPEARSEATARATRGLSSSARLSLVGATATSGSSLED